MHHRSTALAAALASVLGAGTVVALGTGLGSPSEAVPRVASPGPDVVLAVDGDADTGFTVHRGDGTTLHPPTLSETLAECGEYDEAAAVLGCEVEARTWFRDLAVLQASLDWARQHRVRHG